jgi:hypothetical protein
MLPMIALAGEYQGLETYKEAVPVIRLDGIIAVETLVPL